ncbi:DnaJ-domain-containing protein, partial [Sistotremastrum niveocremeum HHB9708]
MFGVTANPGASAIIRLLCWQLLPAFATRQCLAIFHSFLRYLGREPPAPGTPQYAIHWRWTHAAVITAYLFYSFEDASSLLPPNYYELLGVAPNVNDDELKAAFRRFARRNHPDHVGRTGEDLFIAVRDAYEALKDPLKRYAYDRFGKDALNWKLATRTDYMWTGQQQAAMFY